MFNPAPQKFFGPGYALTSSELKLKTATAAYATTGGTITADASTDTITTATDHNLLVNDIVRFTAVGTLAAPLVAATDYYVHSVPTATTLTLSATKGGALINLTTAGSGSNTMQASGTLMEVTDAEAHATTGNWLKVLFGFCEACYQRFNSTPAADRPTQGGITRFSSTNDITGLTTRNYTFRFVVQTDAVEVAPEP